MRLCKLAPVLRLTSLLTLLVLASGMSVQAAHAKDIVMLTADPIDQRGQPFPLKLAEKLFEFIEREENLQIQQQRSPWPRAMQAAENGEGVLYGVSKTKEREKIFRFSLPIQSKYMFLVTRSDAQFRFNSMADLKGKTIGIPRGFSYGDRFDAMKDNLFKVEVDNYAPLSRIYKLLFRRMDAGLFGSVNKDPHFLENKLQTLRDENEGSSSPFADVRLTVLPKPLLIDTIHFAVRADKDDGIIDKLNIAILKARKVGLLEELR